MALIPLKDTVTITKPGAIDEFGDSTPGQSFTYACRIEEGTKRTLDKQGSEVISATQILIEGAVDVGYDDIVTWTDSVGNQWSKKPLRIFVVKDFSSKPLFTEVEL